MRLIIFDCDGTLVDSQNAIFGAMTHAFGGLGLLAPTRPEVLGVVGLSLPEAFRVLAPDLQETTRAELATRYKGAFPQTGLPAIARDPLFPGCKAAIERLAACEGVVLGIATGKSVRGVHRLFDEQGWHPLFATVQTADDNPSKPHPSMVDRAIAETGASRAQTVMIGDTTYDIDMGRNARVKTIAVSWGYHALADLVAAGADATVDGFGDLDAAIDRLFDDDEARR